MADLPTSLDNCKTLRERGRWLHVNNPDAFDPAEPYILTAIKHELRSLDPVDVASWTAELDRWAQAAVEAEQRHYVEDTVNPSRY